MSIRKKTDQEEPLSPHVLQKHEAARCVVDEEGSIVYANDAFCELSGIRADGHYHLLDIIQLSDEIFDEEDTLSELEPGTHDVHIQDNGFMTEFHFDWITTSDNRRFLIASALEDDFHERADDNLDTLMERIQNSAARIESSSHHIEDPPNADTDEYTPFVDMTQDMMVITDISGRIMHANHAFTELSGNNAHEQELSFFDLFRPEDQSHIIRSHQSLAEGQLQSQRLDFEAQIVTPDGHVRWIEWQQKYENDQVYSIGRDITDIKEKHRNLQRREKQLSEAEAIGRMGHWQWLIGEEYISWSEEIYRIFGVDQNHFKPSINTLTGLIHKRDLGRVVQVFQRAIIEEKNYDMEFRVIRPGGDIRFVMCEGRCEKNADGEVIALYGIMQDMTERMLYEEELRRAKDASEQAYAAKTRFLANMSHELRTPLNAIIGFSEMIESQMLGPIFNEKYTEYASSIKESGHHLLDLISDILDMSKIEAGKHVLDLETVLIKDIIDRCFEMIQGRASEQNIQVRPFEISNENLSIIGDRRALVQIFLNLLSNAVKFTPENGAVWIECYESKDYLIFKVCDTGVGIPPNKLASVLRPFEQASSEYTRDHEGTGLGLAITKELIELHGGSIQIESTVNIGTTVNVRLPFAMPES